MTKKILFILLFIFILINNSSAYYLFDKKLEQAYTSILSLRFNEADVLLQQEKTEKPGNDLRLLYLNYIDFLKAFISEDKSEYEKLKINSSIRLTELNRDKNNNLSPFHLYSQSEILIQLAIAGFKFEENIYSANEIRKAYKLITKNKIIFPTFILNDKVSGFLHAIVGSVPKHYQWVVKLAGIDGNVSQGLMELNNLYNSIDTGIFNSYRMEILFYLGNIHSVFSSPSDSLPLISQMKYFGSISPLIAYIYSNILMKQGKNDEALLTLDFAIKDTSAYPFYFLYYKRGLAGLRKLDLSSDYFFNTYLIHSKGINNIKSCYQKLAWLALIKGDTISYYNNLRLCRESGNLLIDEDKDAQYESISGEMSNVFLLRSRLYFDGGYYYPALNEIKNKTIQNFPRYRDQLEITYRLGRILQMTNQTDRAIFDFEMTIKNGENSKYYFAANSSLMLGLIYEEKKQFDKALFYYQKCFTMKNEEYRNSIEQKAKGGIERIKLKQSIK